MTASRSRIVFVDQHPLFIEALCLRLKQTSDLEAVGAAVDSEAGLNLSMEARPHLVVTNVDIPGRGAFALTSELATQLPSARVLFWGDAFSDVLVDEAIRHGAAGYILTNESSESVLESFRLACLGETVFSPQIEARVEFDTTARRFVAKSRGELSSLTIRQFVILRQLAHGASVKNIAKRMGLTQRAIESHKYRIMRRLGIRSRVELAHFAIREGLIKPTPLTVRSAVPELIPDVGKHWELQ